MVCGSNNKQKIYACCKYNKLTKILYFVQHLLNQLDTLPTDILHIAELESRNYRKNKLRVAKASMKQQNLFTREKEKLENHFKSTKLPKKKNNKTTTTTKGKSRMKMRIVSMFSIATSKSLHK